MTQGSALSAETGNGKAGYGWITSVPPEHATGPLAEAYRTQFEKIGQVTELTQIGSLYPDLVAARLKLYAVVDATPSDVPDQLVTDPRHIVEQDVTALRDAGWTDLDILDINNITAYYCYINRVAAGLGLHREA